MAACLPKTGVVGWSKIVDRKMSKLFLKRAKSPEFSFLRFIGSRLKILAPWTAKEFSLALRTRAGELCLIGFGTANPLLSL